MVKGGSRLTSYSKAGKNVQRMLFVFACFAVLVHNGHDDRHHYQLRFGRDLLFPAEGALPSHKHFPILPGLRFRGTPVFFAP